MELQASAQLKGKSRIQKIVIGFFLVILSFIIFLFGYQTISSIIASSKYEPVGDMVDVGGYKLHMYAQGENKGLPTVILESGSGTPSSVSDWRYVQPELAKLTRVITYDRAGYGWSEDAYNERSSNQIVKDLNTLLTESGEKGPFILVGHSFGGYNVQLFANQHPGKVAGIILLDSSIVGEGPDVSATALWVQKLLKEVGIMRLMGDLQILPVPKAVLSEEMSKEFLYSRFYNADQMSEIKLMSSVDESQLKKVQKEGLGNLPLTIISAREEEKEHKDWQAQQDRLAKLSSNSKRLVVEDSSHYIHQDQPDIVIKSVKEMLASVSGHN